MIAKRLIPGTSGYRRRLGMVIIAFAIATCFWTADVKAQAQIHWVQPGESLWSISRQYGTTVSQLISANGLSSDRIFVGDRLVIPAGSTGASADDLRWLAQLIWSEAEGEPYIGKVAVGAVVLNRVRSPLFPNSIRAVIFQGGQFEPVMNGRIYNPAPAVAYQAARDALNGWDPSYGALFFFNPAKTNNPFLWSRPVTTVIGRHRFTR